METSCCRLLLVKTSLYDFKMQTKKQVRSMSIQIWRGVVFSRVAGKRFGALKGEKKIKIAGWQRAASQTRKRSVRRGGRHNWRDMSLTLALAHSSGTHCKFASIRNARGVESNHVLVRLLACRMSPVSEQTCDHHA